jgi:hypothetical protein
MKKIDLSKVKTERELKIALKDLDIRWKAILPIKDPKKRAREILKIKKEIEYMLGEFKRRNMLYHKNDSNINLCNKMFRSMIAWFRGIEKKYKDG